MTSGGLAQGIAILGVGCVVVTVILMLIEYFYLRPRRARDRPLVGTDAENETVTEMARSMDGLTLDRPSMQIRPAFSDGFGYEAQKGCPALSADKARGKMVVPSLKLPTMDEEHRSSTLDTPEVSPTPSPREEEADATPTAARIILGGSLEEDVLTWLEEVSGEERAGLSMQEWLEDGQILCKVANMIQPGIISKVNSGNMDSAPFKKMENISAFIKACRTLGVLENNIFSTVDLYEAKNLRSVQRCIADLGQVIRTTAPTFSGPYLGLERKAAVKDAARDNQMVDLRGGFRRDIDDQLKESHAMGPGGRRI